ncbi:MAG: hypothetical protein D6696_20070 [Acidobacteria bacterium]|nr:MAG: hypothetical protein D6696_20070 [Acidobacteriota bacterium]
MDRPPLPLLILAGRDRHPGVAGRRDGELAGYKAVEVRLGGRPLIAVLVERLRASGAFAPIAVAGPAEVYGPLELDARLIDTSGSFGDNLRAGVEALVAELDPEQLAITTCDVLPSSADLRRVLDDFHRHQPTDFWMPHHPVEDPAELGSSAYKPRYGFRPPDAPRAVPTLPGHLVIVHPRAVRRSLVYRIFDLGYATRNRPVRWRRAVIVRRALGLLLAADLRRLRRGRPPLVTWSLLTAGIRLGNRLIAGDATTTEIEDLLRIMWITRRHRRRHPERRGRFAILPCSSLARDVDTEAEARELVARGTL